MRKTVLTSMDFLNLRTVNDLNTALHRQRTTTRQVLLELDSIGERLLPQSTTEEEELKIANEIRNREVRLLERYSARPSLREFQLPYMKGVANEGGTFGVAAIVGEVLLGNIRAIETRFARVHRSMLMLLMREIDNPKSEHHDLIDFILKFMRIDLREGAVGISEGERQRVLRGLLRPLVEVMILVMQEYGILESLDNKGFRLTAMGRRVMLHLFDAQKFIDEVARTHQRLQQEGNAVPKEVVAN